MVNKKSKNLIKIIISVLAAIVCSFLTEFMLLDADGVMSAYANTYAEKKYNVDADSSVYINDINGFVNTLEIRANAMSSSTLPVTVYYSADGENYSEENCIGVVIAEDEKSILMAINQEVSSLRIDVGTEGCTGSIDRVVTNPHVVNYVRHVITNMSWIHMLNYFLGFLLIIFALRDIKYFLNMLFKYRWAVGCALIVYCTLLKLQGSSIGILSEAMSGHDTSNLWGTSRSIRTDEFAAFTPMALAQAKTGFTQISDIWGYSGTDMFIVYGQPITNLVAIYRPFSLGYIFFGAEYGLAFYWSSRLVMCFLVSFEFARLLTKDDRLLSVAYAFLISLSPIVQWWYAINELVEMLIFGQLAIIIICNYIRTDSVPRKCVMMLGLVLCGGGYILTLYPAWMIPLFYVFLACLVSLLIENRKGIKIKKEDIIIWCGGILLLAASILYIYSISSDAINAVMNTEYPGSRKYNGGTIINFKELFRGWSSYVWSFVDIDNPCEVVDFISFFPLGIILSLIVIFRDKKKDVWLIVLNIFNAVFIVYLLFGMPEIVGTLTMLNKSVANRMVIAIGFINLIIFIRTLTLVEPNRKLLRVILPVSVLATILSVMCYDDSLSSELDGIIIIVAVCATCIIMTFDNPVMKKAFCVFCVVLSIIGGGMVNPINSGLDTIYNNCLIQKIDEINSDDEGMWLTVTSSLRYSNIPTLAGAKTMNALCTYPDYKLWSDLGLEDEEEIWNRYAHIAAYISDETRIELVREDFISLYITPEKVREMGVKYILSMDDLNGYEDFNMLYSSNGFSIYEVVGSE